MADLSTQEAVDAIRALGPPLGEAGQQAIEQIRAAMLEMLPAIPPGYRLVSTYIDRSGDLASNTVVVVSEWEPHRG